MSGRDSLAIDVETLAVVSEDGSGFDYRSLGLTDHAMNCVIAERNRVRDLFTKSQENLIQIGHALLNVKELLPHGTFGSWLDAEFGWSPSSARRFMQVAEQFPEITHVERFEPSALYALAANSVPERIRDQFIDRAESGQPVRLHDVREALGTSRNAKSKADPTTIEIVSELVRLIVQAYDDRGIRTKFGLGKVVKTNLLLEEIAAYEPEDQQGIAEIVAAFGAACVEAATPYLKGGSES